MTEETKTNVETKKFETEISELLELIAHSLYSNKDIFVRELVSNASDALDKIRFLSLTQKELLQGEDKFEIRIILDSKAGTITLSDTGIGMNHDELIKNIGTIAHSGSREFIKNIAKEKKGDLSIIGQFGVGFYSVFMVAKKVTVITKRAGETEGWKWVSEGKGQYTIEKADKKGRGTDILIDLNEDGKEYLEDWKVRSIIRKFSDFVSYDILMPKIDTRSEEEKVKDAKEGKILKQEFEVINSGKALWTRPKKEITDEMYKEFYKHISHDHEEPLARLHFSQEGAVTFTSVLFIPPKAPYDIFSNPDVHGLQLYVKRVFIMDKCKELLPQYLRFIRGIVDTEDLPLNVSREILQQNRVVEKMKKALVKKVLDFLKELTTKEPEKYATFWKEHGTVLKEGFHYDFENKENLSELLRVQTSKTDDKSLISLKDYVARMKENQKNIYYITGESRAEVEASPHLEIFRKKDIEVLYFLDPIDEWLLGALTEYNGKTLSSVAKGELDLGDDIGEKEEIKKAEKDYKGLSEVIRKAFQDKIKDVRVSSRLVDSPCCLVADMGDLGPHMEKLMKAMNRGEFSTKKILEINPEHPVMKHLQELSEKDAKSPELSDWITLLYDQALLAQGSKVEDPKKFNELMNKMLVKAVG